MVGLDQRKLIDPAVTQYTWKMVLKTKKTLDLVCSRCRPRIEMYYVEATCWYAHFVSACCIEII